MATNLVTIDEATQVLGISRSTVWRRVRTGEIPSILRGRRLIQLPRQKSMAVRAKLTSDIPPFTFNHPIFRLVGAGRGSSSQPGARNKHS